MTDNVQDYADINGASLYYETQGRGDAVVFLHAGIADCRMWDGQFDVFSQSYHTLRYDMRGHGRSSLPPQEYAHLADLSALLDYLEISRAHLVGCSQGGRVALEFTLEHPSRVHSLILSAPALRGYEHSEIITQYAEANDAAFAAGDIVRAVQLDMYMWVDGPKRRADTVDPIFRARARTLAAETYRDWPASSIERPLIPRALDRLWQIKAPALILVGEYETPDFITIAGQVAFALDKAEKAMITGAAHLLPMELPDEFNRRALAFLSALGGDVHKG